MLGRVKKSPFGPESLNAGDDNACPDLPGSLDERDGTDVVEIRRV
jgi:hypothetical protein